MSVALIMTGGTSPGLDLYVPILSQAAYRDICVPIARSLELAWLLQFETGCPVPRDFVPEVVHELERLQEVVTSRGSSLAGVAQRLERAIVALREYGGRDGVEVRIG